MTKWDYYYFAVYDYKVRIINFTEIPNDTDIDVLEIEVNDIKNFDEIAISGIILNYTRNIKYGYLCIKIYEISKNKKSVSKQPAVKLGKTLREKISDYTVIDIETTGKSKNTCEIIELSAVKVHNSVVVDKYSTLIQPTKKVPAVVTELTGITNEMLINAPSINEKLPEYLNFIGNGVILGHNISTFDRHIINRYCLELGFNIFDNITLDTYHFARCCNIDVPDYKLTTLTAFFGINHFNSHRALADCIANFECYEKLKKHFDGHYR